MVLKWPSRAFEEQSRSGGLTLKDVWLVGSLTWTHAAH